MDTDEDLGAATAARGVQVLTAISMMAENLMRARQQRAHLQADRDFAATRARRAEHLADHGAARAVYGETGNRDVFDFDLTDNDLAAIDALDTNQRGGPEPTDITLENFGMPIPEA
jgi:hypothetical protein